MVVICSLLTLYMLAIFGVIILSWFPTQPGSALEGVYSFLRRITDPVLGPVRRALPAVGIGGMRLDLSPMIVLIGVQILQSIIC